MQTKGELVAPKWKPEAYNRLSLAQANAASQAIKVLGIHKDHHVLDVGCGDGKISASLSELVSAGSVLAIDKSIEMMDFANNTYTRDKYPNLHFALQDAQAIDFHGVFDLVFSSFALQWVKDKRLFFQKAYKALKEAGRICVIIPLGISPELEFAIEDVIKRPNWSEIYKNFHPNWYFVEENNLLQIADETCFDVNYSSKYTVEVNFPSFQDFEEYVLLWFPYLSPLREELKTIFFLQVMGEYRKMLSPTENGSICMRIPVLSLIGNKISL